MAKIVHSSSENLENINPLKPMSDQDRISPYYINIKQKSDEDKKNYQLGDDQLIQYQNLWTSILRIVWQMVRRIT